MATKICRSCGLPKDAEKDFTWRTNGKGSSRIPYADCKLCRQTRLTADYNENEAIRNAARKRNRESARRKRAKLAELAGNRPN